MPAGLRKLPDTKLTLSYEAGEAGSSFPDGRTQTIHIRRAGDCYVMTSRAIGGIKAGNMVPTDLARQMVSWESRD
jgi:hypothetical protein